MSLTIPPIGFHCLRDFETRGAAFWKAKYLDKTLPLFPASTAMMIGTAVHALALEGEAALHKAFATAPAGDWESEDRKIANEIAGGINPLVINEMPNRRTNAGKVEWAGHLVAAAGARIITSADRERLIPLVDTYRATVGKTLLSASDFQMVERMGAAVRSHPQAMDLIRICRAEVELEGTIEVTGITGPVTIPVRGRLDLAGPGFIADLKTCEDLTPSVFDRTVANYEYFRQCDYYDMLRVLAGDESPTQPDARAFLIVVEKPDSTFTPVRVSVVAMQDDYLALGHQRNMAALESLAGTFAADAWSPLVPGIRRLGPPRWIS